MFDLRNSPQSSPKSNDGSIRVVRYFIGDDAELPVQPADIRAMVTELPSDSDLQTILLDSGADAAVFPASFGRSGSKVTDETVVLHDAQGTVIPVEDMRDMEIQLLDQHGRLITIQECVAVSSRIQQPILSFGKMLECGWGLDSREQALIHETGNVRVPVELQHRSIVVKGWVRVINEEPKVEEEHLQPKAEVTRALRLGPAGRSLDERNCGVGRHHSSYYQNPMLVRPEMSGKLARTTLLRDHGEWFVLELCEPLESLLDPSAEFYGYEGSRDT